MNEKFLPELARRLGREGLTTGTMKENSQIGRAHV